MAERELYRNHVDTLVLNHAEMVYRPGHREEARAFFEILGFEVRELGPWLMILIDGEVSNGVDNTMYCSEATPAQQKFEDALQRALGADQELADSLEHYQDVMRAHPQFSFHFGATIPTHAEWEQRTQRVRDAANDDPLLAGRVNVVALEPGHPAALGPQSQAFIHTDILAAGFLPFGLVFELQWTPVAGPSRQVVFGSEPIDFPDIGSLV